MTNDNWCFKLNKKEIKAYMNKQNNSKRRARQLYWHKLSFVNCQLSIKKLYRHKFSIVISQLLIALLIALSIAMFSCTEYHFSSPSDSFMVRIRPDNSHYKYNLSGLEYRFYGTDTCIIRSGDARGNFEGRLSRGTYRVLATNTNAERATFTGLNTYDGATVGAPAVSGSEDTDPDIPEQWSPVDTVDNVYSVYVEELKVSAGGAVEKTPLPVLLTRELVFVFSLSGGLGTGVTSISGTLPGVFPSVRLSTGLPSSESLNQSRRTAVVFSAPATDGKCSARIGLLGLRDPEEGSAYTCNLSLSLLMNGGDKEETEISLTSLFSEIFMKNGGTLPQQLYIYITIAVEASEIGGVGGSILGWGTGEEENLTISWSSVELTDSFLID
jgi:hypothetical protein